MTKKNIEELFVHNGRDFVTTAYQYILNREPDEQGLMYYMGRLAQGHSKDSVIVQLAKSQECIPHDEITGLKQLISEENRSQHWFWGIVGRRSRMQRYLQGNMYVIALMLKELQALHEVLDSKTHILNKSHEARSTVNQNNVPVRREQTCLLYTSPSPRD